MDRRSAIEDLSARLKKKQKSQQIQETPQQEKELEEIVEETIQEVLEQEEIDEQTIKEFDELQENIKSEQIVAEQATNNEIINECLKNRSKTQDVKNDVHSLRVKEAEHFIEVMKELHFIKKHMGKFAVLSLGIIFFCGYIFGTQHEHISPYIGKVLDVMNLFKGNGGQ